MSPFASSINSLPYIILSFFFVLLNAFFVAAEFALVKIRVTRLEILVKEGRSIARLAQKMVDNLDAYLSATQLGITLASLGLGWLGEPAFSKLITPLLEMMGRDFSPATIHSLSFAIAFGFISTLHIILGELVPKSLAIQTAEKVCLFIAVPMRVFYIVFFPFLWILNGLSNLTLKLIHLKPEGGPARAHSGEELKLIFEDSVEEGALQSGQRVLLDKAIDFSNKTVRDIMVPVHNMICFYLDETLEENLAAAKESGHTRVPLCEKKGGKVLGFIHIKDIIWSLEHGDVINLYDLKRPLFSFEGNTKLDVALKVFQKRRVHVAVVQDPGSQVEGLVTLEDVIEELVGEIEDEFDFPIN